MPGKHAERRDVSSAFELDKNIPIPDPLRRRSPDVRYQWADMEVGDSFFVPLNADGSAVDMQTMRRRVSQRIQNARKRLGRKTHHFIQRPWKQEDGTEGIRVWRVDPPQRK